MRGSFYAPNSNAVLEWAKIKKHPTMQGAFPSYENKLNIFKHLRRVSSSASALISSSKVLL